jgi:formylglycine-generating enzyme required for sulfatase activity
MSRTQAGRAQLAQLLCDLPAGVDQAALLLGFIAPERALEVSGAPVGQQPVGEPPAEPAPEAEVNPRPPMWRVMRIEHLGPPPEAPTTPTRAALPLTGSIVTDREAAPINPWPRLWPRIHQLISAPIAGHSIDAPRLVRAIAKGKQPRRLPKRVHHRWPHALEVWVDRSDRIIPIHQDQRDVVRALRGLVNRRIKVRYLAPGTPVESLAGQGDAPVLLLGDLGHYGDAALQTRWRQLGARLRANGRLALALVPTDRPYAGTPWQTLPWGPCPVAGTCPEHLLDLTAPAELVQPGLLRALRQLLTAQGVAAELRAWNHADVEVQMSVGLALTKEASAVRRKSLAGTPEHHRAVRQLIDLWHADMLSETRHIQALSWAALGFDGDAPGDLADARAWLMGLRAKVDPSGDPGPWHPFLRTLLDRLPGEAFEDPEVGAILSELVAYAVRDEDGVELPPQLNAAYLGTPNASPRPVVLRQRGDTLHTGPQGVPLAMLQATGETWQVNGHQQGIGEPIKLGKAAIEIKTDQTAASLDRHPWPSWATAMGVEAGRTWATVSLGDGDHRLWWGPEGGPKGASGWYTQSSQDRQLGADQYGVFEEVQIAGEPVRFRHIPAGSFMMGSPEDEVGRYGGEGPQHKVTLTEPFWLAETPTTQAVWRAAMGVTPSWFNRQRPVVMVSWDDAQRLITQVNEAQPRLNLALPTEAQWEYACRAGSTTATYAGDNSASALDAIAWYNGNSGHGTQPVALKAPNAWGLYDTLGNVLEWCADVWAGTYEPGVQVNPTGPRKGADRVFRGGSWIIHARLVRAAYRSRYEPGIRLHNLGFRLARGQSAERPRSGQWTQPPLSGEWAQPDPARSDWPEGQLRSGGGGARPKGSLSFANMMRKRRRERDAD